MLRSFKDNSGYIPNTRFQKATCDLFAERTFAEMGEWRFSKPLFENDIVDGIGEWDNLPPQYYVPGAEFQIVHDAAPDLERFAPDGTLLIDLGPGGKKGHQKIESLIDQFGEKVTGYLGVDNVLEILKNAETYFQTRYPDIEAGSLLQDFFEEELLLPDDGHRLAAIFGLTLSNLKGDPRTPGILEAKIIRRLQKLARNLRDGETLLVTQHHNTDVDEILACYQAQEKVWRSVLYRMQRDLPIEGEFNPEDIAYESYWVEDNDIVAHTYRILNNMEFSIGDEEFSLPKGKRFFLHNSSIIPLEKFIELQRKAKLKNAYIKTDEGNKFSLHALT